MNIIPSQEQKQNKNIPKVAQEQVSQEKQMFLWRLCISGDLTGKNQEREHIFFLF